MIAVCRPVLFALLAVSSSSFAAGPRVEPLTRADLCQEILESQDVQQSELWRQHINARLEKYQRRVEALRTSLTQAFFLGINRRSESGLMDAPPAILQSTRDALDRIQDDSQYSGVTDHFGRGLIVTRLVNEARDAMLVDPYFIWLQQHKVDNRIQRHTSNYALTPEGFLPVAVATDPIELVISSFHFTGPSVLTPQLALVRMIRDLDPHLTPHQLSMSHTILSFYATQTLIQLDLREQFASRSPAWGSSHAWNLASDLATAQHNYNRILASARLYAGEFSRPGFELAQELYATQPPLVDAIRRLGKVNTGDNEPDPVDVEQVNALKLRFGLSRQVTAERLFDLIVSAGRRGMNYELFLIRNFMPTEDGELFERTMNGLKLILEVGEVIDSDDALTEYVIERMRQVGYFNYLN